MSNHNTVDGFGFYFTPFPGFDAKDLCDAAEKEEVKFGTAEGCGVRFRPTSDEEVFDKVNHPLHYTLGANGIECIDAIKASMSGYEFRGYLKGNVMKYLWRYRLKGRDKEDLQKAQWYLNRLIEEL